MLLLKIGVVGKVLRTLGAYICNFLYRIIATMYQLFMTISRLDILSSEQIGSGLAEISREGLTDSVQADLITMVEEKDKPKEIEQ